MPAVGLAVLAGAVRLQYAPLALVLLGIVFLRSQDKMRLALAAAGLVLAVGVFDAVTGDGGLFHSYVTNVRFNVAGVLNALPFQDRLYRAWSNETGAVRFVRRHDPIFAAYRHLATAPGVGAVWQTDRAHYNLPGYYYLHRAIPFYDTVTADSIRRGGPELTATVSHIVSADPELAVPGYSVEREFGAVRILRRDESEPPIRRWQAYAPVLVDELTMRIMRRVDPHAPPAPANAGIRFEEL